MGDWAGGAGEGVGEQGAGQHHHVGALSQGRLDRCYRNKALEMTDFYIVYIQPLRTQIRIK